MKESKFTPGPWTCDGYDNKTDSIIVSGQWGTIARVINNGSTDQRDANAALIASAPELLRQRDELIAALRKIESFSTKQICDNKENIDSWAKIAGIAIDALIKISIATKEGK